MKEPAVSIFVALHYIRNGLTDQNVVISLDGAHMQTSGVNHFDLLKFMKENKCIKESDEKKWQGTYRVEGFLPRIVIVSKPGMGDVVVSLRSGKTIRVESKKGEVGNKSGSEYPLMREAIGQLMTGCELSEDLIPAVAVPFSERSCKLAKQWSEYTQIKRIGLKFLLVRETGELTEF